MMKILAVVLLVVFVLGPVSRSVLAQSAKVIPLSTEDAAEAKSLSDQQAALEKKKEDFRKSIERKYLTTMSDQKDASSCLAEVTDGTSVVTLVGPLNGNVSGLGIPTDKPPVERKPYPVYKSGWDCGRFEYSEDFRYIVPAPEPPLQRQPWCGGWVNSGTDQN